MPDSTSVAAPRSPWPWLPALGADFRRFTLVVLDGAGIGQAPDLPAAGTRHGGPGDLARPDQPADPQPGDADPGADTLRHVLEAAGPLALPNLVALGLGDLDPRFRARVPGHGTSPGMAAAVRPGVSLRLVPVSRSKDTLTGHWELAGLSTDLGLRTFPGGFPPAMMAALTRAMGREPLGGMPASGTGIIRRLGPRHLTTGRPIVYTSADSVLQVAAHEEVIPPAELYRMCLAAREVATGEWLVGRVIARPFTGRAGSFTRTAGRRDFSLAPPGPTVLDAAVAAGVEVVAVGKVADVFAGRGITRAVAAHDNGEVTKALKNLTEEPLVPGRRRFVFANLNDFDARYGHRRDPVGFGRALEAFDRSIPDLLPLPESGPGDGIFAVTADHGCDPTYPGTDHTRESVPLLIYGTGWPPACLGSVRGLFAVAGLASAAFGLEGFAFWPRKENGRADH